MERAAGCTDVTCAEVLQGGSEDSGFWVVKAWKGVSAVQALIGAN